MPPWGKRALAFAINCASPIIRNRSKTPVFRGDANAKLQKLSTAITAGNVDELYKVLLSGSIDDQIWQAEDTFNVMRDTESGESLNDIEKMMLFDQLFYLPDAILVKVDRAAMHCSLETRAPLLHPEIVALAWKFPRGMKFRNGVNKWALREVLHRHVPKALVDRPKAGFEVPVAQWLRGPLRDLSLIHI